MLPLDDRDGARYRLRVRRARDCGREAWARDRPSASTSIPTRSTTRETTSASIDMGDRVRFEEGDFRDMSAAARTSSWPISPADCSSDRPATLRELVAPGGSLIVSGFMESETAAVVPALERVLTLADDRPGRGMDVRGVSPQLVPGSAAALALPTNRARCSAAPRSPRLRPHRHAASRRAERQQRHAGGRGVATSCGIPSAFRTDQDQSRSTGASFEAGRARRRLARVAPGSTNISRVCARRRTAAAPRNSSVS